MKLDVVIPAYNEEGVIAETAGLIAAELGRIPGLYWRIVVSENGSTDGTADAVLSLRHPQIRVYRAKGRGKGVAIREAFSGSDADIVAFFDADLSVDPSAIHRAVEILAEGRADIVIGSRFHPDSRTDRSKYRTATSRVFNFLGRTIVGIGVSDSQCGFKVMNQKGKEAFLLSADATWFFDLEFLARAERRGLFIVEQPVLWTEFRYRSRRSKLNVLTDGLRAVVEMVRIRNAVRK